VLMLLQHHKATAGQGGHSAGSGPLCVVVLASTHLTPAPLVTLAGH
jgi:hypothetical protein